MKYSLGFKPSRLLIYFFYDKDGIIDDYITYQLSDLEKNVDSILFVSNGNLAETSKNKLKEIRIRVLERNNTGFDVWAYKEGMEYFGWDSINKYDELILMNFTMYGPLFPFKIMFDEMNQRDVDFWGITKHHGFPFDPFGTIACGYIPEHIQSSFICIRNSMHTSEQFHLYWENMTSVNSYGESIGKHEAIFTKTFVEYGFVSDVYVQTDDLKKYTHYPLMIEPLELIKERKCPVIKRKSFCNEYFEFLNCCLGEPTVEMFEYVQQNTNYDVNMIWDNLLRIENMSDLKNRLHLNYTLPRDLRLANEQIKCRTALMLHIYNTDLIDYCFEYVKSMPNYADVFITTDSEDKKNKIEKKFLNLVCNKFIVLLTENRGRDVSALLVTLKPYVMNYDLVCFAHDKKTSQMEPYTIGKSFSYKCFENILGSSQYVDNIIFTFNNNKRLGMLFPPPPNHAAFYGIFGTEWGSNFDNTKKLASELRINVNIDVVKEPISPLGTMFWFRPKALITLFNKDWKYADFPDEPNEYDGTILHAIERMYGFVVQSEGYYPAWVMHDKFAAIELTNYHFMLRELSMNIYKKIGHQMGFSIANHNLLNYNGEPLRKTIKYSIKKRMPTVLWNIFRKFYRIFKGKK
jgi:rhamnosyltransferase